MPSQEGMGSSSVVGDVFGGGGVIGGRGVRVRVLVSARGPGFF